MTRFRLPAAACAVLLLAIAGRAVADPLTRNFEFLANLNEYPQIPATAKAYSSCWSYVHGDGREYAILGAHEGTAIYNVTTPTAPYRVAFIPGPASVWRGMKSYRNWIYIVTEGSGAGQGLQIVRMTDPEHPVLAATYARNFVRSHTVAIDTARALLICNGTSDANGQATGMRILSIADPEAPVELGWWPGVTIPVAADDYVHDCVPIGGLLYAASIYGGFARVFDFSNPAAPALLHDWTYPGAFTHNIWPTPDGRTIYVTDEVRGEPLKVFDVSDPAAPRLANGVTSNPHAIVHNAHVANGELYLANYTEGIRALDISDPLHPAEFAEADSYFGPSGGFAGVWEVCPYFPSGIVIASDMQTGLYVYRPVRDYGILRTRVQYADGSPAAGVEVFLTTQGDSITAPADGIVQFAPSPGTHTVQAKPFGFYTASATRLISKGLRDTVVLTLVRRPKTLFAGQVRSAATHAPLEDAEVHVEYTALPTARTSASGGFDFGAIPRDDYRLTVRCPGFIPFATTARMAAGATTRDFELVPAPIYDPLETDLGWTVGGPGTGDNATGGQWVRVDPLGTGQPAVLALFGSVVPPCCRNLPACTGECMMVRTSESQAALPGDAQPDDDRTPPPGTQCFVTGQGTSPADLGEADVDNGKTSLTSPAWDLTGMREPTLGYWRWFYATGADDDWFAVFLSNDDGATWTAVDTTRGPASFRWEERAIPVARYLTPTGHMRLRFVAADMNPPDIVEAAVDDIVAYDATAAIAPPPDPGAAIGAMCFGIPRPNPSRDAVTVDLVLPRAAAVAIEVFDVNGRIVRTLERGTFDAGPHTVHWDGREDGGEGAPAGLYFLRARAGGRTAETRIVRVR